MRKLILIAAVGLVVPIASLAQAAQDNMWAGTWKMNAAKSKFHPGPGLKGETVTIPAGEGKVEVHELGANGKENDWSYAAGAPEGTTVPIEGTGMEGATVSGKTVSDHVQDHTWKFPNMNAIGHAVL